VIPALGSADIAFLNEKKIGSTGEFPPYFENKYCVERIYYLPFSLLKIKNILRILIYSPEQTGGILHQSPAIYTAEELRNIRGTSLQPSQNLLMPFSNGICSANFDKTHIHFNSFYPKLYRDYNAEKTTALVLQKLEPVIYQNNIPLQLQQKKSTTTYIQGTGIIEHVITLEKNRIRLIGFSPFTEKEALWIFYIVFEGENLDTFQGDFRHNGVAENLKIHKEAFTGNQKKWVRLILQYPNHDADDFSMTRYKNTHSNFSIFLQELRWWKNWQNSVEIPNNMTESQVNFYLHSLVMLKMAQCREDFPLKGQILSGFYPGANQVSLLDQSLAIEALILSNHLEEARSCLQYLFHGRCGKYKNFDLFGINHGLLNDYCLSVQDYYSNGTEKPINPARPVMTLAPFGLTLSNLRNYVEATRDYQFLEYYWPKIYKEIALVLINLIDESGLIRTDSGFFGDELPGKHFLYTSALSHRGLIDAAWLARLMTQETAAQELEFFANKIRVNIQRHFYQDKQGLVRTSIEGRTKDHYLDATVSSIINVIYTSQDEIAKAAIATAEQYLTSKTSPLFFSKYSYNFIDQEYSTFLNLNLAEAYYKMNNNEKGDAIVNFLIDFTKPNAFLLPQNINPVFYSYSGCTSLKAHAAYIKAIQYRR
jgi:GH15 family glucan-1,4-alpha-glucosidase